MPPSKGPWRIVDDHWHADDQRDVVSSDEPPELLAVSVSLADAALIAAAPEMLRALERASVHIWEEDLEDSDTLRMVNAAIAKAKGEEFPGDVVRDCYRRIVARALREYLASSISASDFVERVVDAVRPAKEAVK